MWKSGIDDGVKTGNAAEYYPVKSKFVKRVKISKMLVVKIFLGFFPVRLSTPGKDNSRQHSFMHDVGLQSSFIYTWELHHQLRPHLAHFHLFFTKPRRTGNTYSRRSRSLKSLSCRQFFHCRTKHQTRSISSFWEAKVKPPLIVINPIGLRLHINYLQSLLNKLG